MCKSDGIKMHLTEMFQKWDVVRCSGWSSGREKSLKTVVQGQISAGAVLQLCLLAQWLRVIHRGSKYCWVCPWFIEEPVFAEISS